MLEGMEKAHISLVDHREIVLVYKVCCLELGILVLRDEVSRRIRRILKVDCNNLVLGRALVGYEVELGAVVSQTEIISYQRNGSRS